MPENAYNIFSDEPATGTLFRAPKLVTRSICAGERLEALYSLLWPHTRVLYVVVHTLKHTHAIHTTVCIVGILLLWI